MGGTQEDEGVVEKLVPQSLRDREVDVRREEVTAVETWESLAPERFPQRVFASRLCGGSGCTEEKKGQAWSNLNKKRDEEEIVKSFGFGRSTIFSLEALCGSASLKESASS